MLQKFMEESQVAEPPAPPMCGTVPRGSTRWLTKDVPTIPGPAVHCRNKSFSPAAVISCSCKFTTKECAYKQINYIICPALCTPISDRSHVLQVKDNSKV